jgi:hypothetical protein
MTLASLYIHLEAMVKEVIHDIQFSKGPLNKNQKVEVKINGKEEKLCYRTAP